jgi:hypothetical protein
LSDAVDLLDEYYHGIASLPAKGIYFQKSVMIMPCWKGSAEAGNTQESIHCFHRPSLAGEQAGYCFFAMTSLRNPNHPYKNTASATGAVSTVNQNYAAAYLNYAVVNQNYKARWLKISTPLP